MKRIHFLQTSGYALGSALIGNSVFDLNTGIRNNILSFPDKVTTLLAGKEFLLFKIGTGKCGVENLTVSLIQATNSVEVFVDVTKITLGQIICN